MLPNDTHNEGMFWSFHVVAKGSLRRVEAVWEGQSMWKHIGSAVVILAISAAGTPAVPQQPRKVPPLNYANFSNDDLCDSFGNLVHMLNEVKRGQEVPGLGGDVEGLKRDYDRVHALIEKRRLIPAKDWTLVAKETVDLDMSRCSVLSAWGEPDHVTRSKFGDVETEAWIYEDPPRMVTLSNGVVSIVTAH